MKPTPTVPQDAHGTPLPGEKVFAAQVLQIASPVVVQALEAEEPAGHTLHAVHEAALLVVE